MEWLRMLSGIAEHTSGGRSRPRTATTLRPPAAALRAANKAAMHCPPGRDPESFRAETIRTGTPDRPGHHPSFHRQNVPGLATTSRPPAMHCPPGRDPEISSRTMRVRTPMLGAPSKAHDPGAPTPRRGYDLPQLPCAQRARQRCTISQIANQTSRCEGDPRQRNKRARNDPCRQPPATALLSGF
jgi:hypothetical protein